MGENNYVSESEPPISDGRVDSLGSVWKIHYTGGRPDESEVALALKDLGVVRVEHVVTAGSARVTPTL